ncbi:hypothetical protein MJD09_05100 [bacterium]|nr:hypothetical protein [bacterium]
MSLHDQREKNRHSFVDSAQWVATILALGSTIFAVPLLWNQIDNLIWNALNQLYERDMAGFWWWCLRLGLYPLVFALARMTLVTSIVTAAVVGATRFV